MAVVIKVGETGSVPVDVGEKVYIKGDPGFSPTIEVTDITGGHRLTITDINGDKTVDVMNGAKGDKGDKGDPGEVTQAEFDALAEEVSDAIEGKQDAPAGAGAAGQVLGLDSSLNPTWLNQGGGSSDYNALSNKPQIEGVTLSGNKTASDLGLALASDIPAVPVQSVNGKTGAVVLSASDVGALPGSTAIPSKTSDLTNDSGFVNAAGAAAAAPVQSVNGNTGAVTVQSTITAGGILKGNGSGGVSAAVAGTDYLTPATNYSPIKNVTSTDYTLIASDIGKTLAPEYTTTHGQPTTFTLPQSVSALFPPAAEIAFFWQHSSSLKLKFSGGVRCAKAGDTAFIQNASYNFPDMFSMVVIKKTGANSNGDWWIVQGNVEVVS